MERKMACTCFSGFCVKGLDILGLLRDVTVSAAVLSVKSKCVINRLNSLVVLLVPRHLLDDRVVGKLCDEEEIVFLDEVLDSELAPEVACAVSTLGSSTIEKLNGQKLTKWVEL